MADRPGAHDDAALAVAARHALHDEELIAAFAVDGAATDDPARAQALVERCPSCQELHADLVAITGGVRSLGGAAAAHVRAPRDFRLTAADAARLRPASLLRRIAATWFGGVATFGRPVGATLATFGLVGLLVGAVGLGPLGGSAASVGGSAASAPGEAFATNAPAPGDALATAAPGPQLPEGGAAGGPPAATDDGRTALQLDPAATADPGIEGPTLALPDDGRPGGGTIPWLFAGSVIALVLGVALLLAGRKADRRPATRGRG